MDPEIKRELDKIKRNQEEVGRKVEASTHINQQKFEQQLFTLERRLGNLDHRLEGIERRLMAKIERIMLQAKRPPRHNSDDTRPMPPIR